MASNTYVALQTVTASSASTVSFTSIPSTYTDLRIVAVGISSTTGSSVNNWRMTFNGDSTSGLYSNTALYGNGSTASSNRDSNGNFMYLGLVGQASNTAQPVSTFDIMNYSNNTTNKTVLSRGSSASDSTYAMVGLWRNTAVINRVDLFMSGATVTGTFTIYGIAAATPLTAKATGGTIYYGADGYVYHKFTSSGTFTPSQNLTVDYLVVAGGGGGSSTGGGGGAGGLRSTMIATGGGGSLETPLSLTSGTGYTVTVGAGGAGDSTVTGSNSVFASITSLGGGCGGGNASPRQNGVSGGSGGGARSDIAGTTAGSGTAGQGYAGARSIYGGGGGAGAPGTAGGTDATGSSGGIGVALTQVANTTSSGDSGYYAGGGGSIASSANPAGGLGGGGRGGLYPGQGNNGVANTGGGGGASSNSPFASGGSGIVIVRYLG